VGLRPSSARVGALNAAGVPADVATAGLTMPDGDLLDVDGRRTSLAEAREDRRRPRVLSRRVVPLLQYHLAHLSERLVPRRLADRDVRLIAISPQAPDAAR